MKTLSVTEEFKNRVEAFASQLHRDCLRGYLAVHQDGKSVEQLEPHLQDCACRATVTTVHYGKTWVRVDVGSSGRYMVDADGNIVGIKGYGVPHKGHQFGTLDTIDQWDWSSYSAVRKAVAK